MRSNRPVRAAAVGAFASLAVVGAADLRVAAAQERPGADTPPRAPTRGPRIEDAAYRATVAARQAKLAALTPVTDALLADPPSGAWLNWRRTYDGLGYSPLDQIDRRNVAGLQVAWSWALAVSPNEITPLVHEGVLFIASANRVQALDARTGDLLWQYTRPLPATAFGGALHISKNLAIYGDRLFATTADRHVIALDVKTGQLAWEKEIIPADVPGPRLTGGPIAVRGKVIQGVSSCNNLKGGCFIVALDARTGEEAWRFNSIARPGEPGGDTWNNAPLDERYGGAVWTSGSYDPELNQLYFGIGQTYDTATLLMPRDGVVGPNDGLYTASTVSLDPDTGRLNWHYQHFKREVWDFDWVFERILTTLRVDGRDRKVAITTGKHGVTDVIDRTNGQYLFSRDFGLQNLITGIDPRTGDKMIDPSLAPERGVTKHICPHAGGARSWPAAAYNPRTQVMYMPLVESCMDFTWRVRTPEETAAGGSDIGWVLKPRPDSDGDFGRVTAMEVATGRTAWIQRQRAPEVSALLATAGGLVFEGSRDRMFRARDEATGESLWAARLNAVPSSFPITYAVDGRQYVAVVAGGGGAHEATWPTLTPEIDNPGGATTLWVFALPERRP